MSRPPKGADYAQADRQAFLERENRRRTADRLLEAYTPRRFVADLIEISIVLAITLALCGAARAIADYLASLP